MKLSDDLIEESIGDCVCVADVFDDFHHTKAIECDLGSNIEDAHKTKEHELWSSVCGKCP